VPVEAIGKRAELASALRLRLMTLRLNCHALAAEL
jgi:hypothetical protein